MYFRIKCGIYFHLCGSCYSEINPQQNYLQTENDKTALHVTSEFRNTNKSNISCFQPVSRFTFKICHTQGNIRIQAVSKIFAVAVDWAEYTK
jgi:hypothetical protein